MMGVLTISRELGSGGDGIGKVVAQELGWSLLDNDGFAEAAQSYGYVRAELEQVDERKPGLIDRFFRDRQLVYLDIMRAIVYESALKNDFVILGRGAHILLEGIEGVFRTRILAPEDYRRRTLVKNEGVTPSMAEQFIHHNDHERMAYTRHFFDVRWGEPSHFDLMLNTGLFHEDMATRLLVNIMKEEKFLCLQPSESQKLRNLAFGQKIKATIMTDERIDASGIVVECPEPGRLLLHGRVNSDEEKELAESIARGYAGVRELQSELVVMPPIEGWYPV